MAQLDPLIQAMFQHDAEGLVLRAGSKPGLLLGGTERVVAKSELTAAHVARLAAEIAPPPERAAVAAGGPATWTYQVDGRPTAVEFAAGATLTIRPLRAAPAAAAPPPVAPTVMRTPAPAAPPAGSPAVSAGAPPPAPPAAANSRAAAAAAPAVAPERAPRPEPPAVAGEWDMDRRLRELVERGGSDLHLSSGARPMLRVDGELVESGAAALGPAEVERLLLSIAPESNREEFRESGDTDFAHEIDGLCRFRCNLFLDRRGPGGVFRVIPSRILTVEDLGLSQAIRNLCHLTKGLVLVTGPTGSGKSTTLCAMVDYINRIRRDHVITIEDPIEFVHANKSCLINQREVHVHTAGFKKALRAALREDPDVVLVGEMRDLETVAIAIETAETGHLVFGTLHTSSAVSTVDRIIDQFPPDQQEQIRIMLAGSLKGVIAQVLCRRIGGGRLAALEVLIVNVAVSNLIREGKTFQIPSIMQTGRAQGNVLLNAALLELVKKKQVEAEEAFLRAIDKHNLLSTFEREGISTAFVKKEERAAECAPA
jgi:twitching motility protein PilT